MKHTHCTENRLKRLMKWPLLCGLLAFALARVASGQQDLYDNESVFTCPPAIIPTIDATNFLNNDVFTIDFPSSSYLNLYETRDTLNYTNNGLMTCNNGFLFDTYNYTSGFHSNAASFYNAGTIRCGSAIDGATTVDGYPPEFIVRATNIVNSGTVVVGQGPVIVNITGNTETLAEEGGLLQFTGQDVDLSRSTLSVETANLNMTGAGAFGTDTNQDWTPSVDLSPTFAISSQSSPPSPAFQLYLPNSTPYFVTNAITTNDIVITAVFIENDSSNVSYNVYLQPYVPPTPYYDYGTEAIVEWIGSYVDSATGDMRSNYLYLEDYVESVTTNVLAINANGLPDNFFFEESPTQIPIGVPSISAYPYGLIQPSGIVTNLYSFATAQFIDTSVPTNSVLDGSLTNLPGRVQINASRKLDLSHASIGGLNYMSLTSSNQFDGSTGARIFSPYSGINIGVTNGFLTVSNLTESSIPLWNGTVQCWSGRWLTLSTNSVIIVDTNGVSTTNSFAATNELRVLIVGGPGSQIAPTTPSMVQDLTLHGTNSIVISDAFHILRSFYTDAQSLTLTTNGAGVGAESLDGELDLEPPLLFWANCAPNLVNLTNNGTILLQNANVFGATNRYYHNFITTGVISDMGSQVRAENFNASGIFANGSGSFTLQSTNVVLTNLSFTAGGDVSIASGSIFASNIVLQAGRSLTLSATNLLTDGIAPGSTIVTNGNIWTVGSNAISGQAVLSLQVLSTNGCGLLGTTITTIAPTNKDVIVTWAGRDYGVSSAGFTNNGEVGRLILDAQGTSPQSGVFTFKGAGVSNAIYVDYLELDGAATNETSYNFSALSINTNITIYFAQAVMNGVSVAEKIDNASRYNGRNNGRLRWVPTYAGHYSSTNFVYPGGATNTVNAALAQSSVIDSDGDGIPNASDPTPFFLASNLNFTETLTNVPPKSILLSWQTIPGATNYVYYTTNLVSPRWSLLQTNSSLPANPFISPQPYGSPATNVSVLDSVNPAQPKYYKVTVQPWLTYPY